MSSVMYMAVSKFCLLNLSLSWMESFLCTVNITWIMDELPYEVNCTQSKTSDQTKSDPLQENQRHQVKCK